MFRFYSLFSSFFQVIDKSFGFDTAVEEAQRAISAAHVEALSIENGIGLVKLMGHYSGTFQADKLYARVMFLLVSCLIIVLEDPIFAIAIFNL